MTGLSQMNHKKQSKSACFGGPDVMYEKIAADTMMEKDGATDLGLPSAVQPEQQLLVGY